MKLRTILASGLLIFAVAGCTQKPVPPPYPSGSGAGAGLPLPGPVSDSGAAGPEPLPVKSVPQSPGDPGLSGVSPGVPGPITEAELLSSAFVDERIAEYQNKMQRWKEADQRSAVATLDPRQTQIMVDCYRDLQRLLTGYRTLQERLRGGQALVPPGGEEIVDLQRQDIALLEGDCAPLLQVSAGAMAGMGEAGVGSGPGQMDRLIESKFNDGEYAQVVQLWAQIPDEDKGRIGQAALRAYGEALIRLDEPARAAEVYQQLVQGLAKAPDQAVDPLLLRKRLADLHAAAGDFFKAEDQYEQLTREYGAAGRIDDWAKLQLTLLQRSMKGSPELTDYSELLRAHLKFIPATDGYAVVHQAEGFLQRYPYSPVSANVDIIKEEALTQADRWFEGVLAEAGRLEQNGQPAEAIALLETVVQEKLTPEGLARLNDRLDALVLAEAVDRETAKIEAMQALQTIWSEGTTLAESGDYDAAIAAFGRLLGTDYEDRAREKIGELTSVAANSERRRAAEIFVRAGKTDDAETQKQLLLESRQTLNDILKKYPDADVADKVRGNIITVEKRINELDPQLLPGLESREREQQRLEQSGSSAPPAPDGFTPFSPAAAQSPPAPAPKALPVYTPQSLP